MAKWFLGGVRRRSGGPGNGRVEHAAIRVSKLVRRAARQDIGMVRLIPSPSSSAEPRREWAGRETTLKRSMKSNTTYDKKSTPSLTSAKRFKQIEWPLNKFDACQGLY